LTNLGVVRLLSGCAVVSGCSELDDVSELLERECRLAGDGGALCRVASPGPPEISGLQGEVDGLLKVLDSVDAGLSPRSPEENVRVSEEQPGLPHELVETCLKNLDGRVEVAVAGFGLSQPSANEALARRSRCEGLLGQLLDPWRGVGDARFDDADQEQFRLRCPRTGPVQELFCEHRIVAAQCSDGSSLGEELRPATGGDCCGSIECDDSLFGCAVRLGCCAQCSPKLGRRREPRWGFVQENPDVHRDTAAVLKPPDHGFGVGTSAASQIDLGCDRARETSQRCQIKPISTERDGRRSRAQLVDRVEDDSLAKLQVSEIGLDRLVRSQRCRDRRLN
jgi:hypothetical protein